MKIVQLVDNLFADYVIDTVEAFTAASKALGLDVYVCAFRRPSDIGLPLAEKSILGCLDHNDIVVLHMESLDTYYFLDFLMLTCKKVIYYYGGFDPAQIGDATPALLTRSELSYDQLKIFAGEVDAAIASTPYHLGILKQLGFVSLH